MQYLNEFKNLEGTFLSLETSMKTLAWPGARLPLLLLLLTRGKAPRCVADEECGEPPG